MNIVAHNLSAMNAQRQFDINLKNKVKSTEKLSSGYKINRAADDAAGLAISAKMRRQIRGLTQGVENTQEGISLCQVADGALTEVDDMLHRITELAVKSANGTNTAQDRQYIQEEIQHLLEEIDKIADTTTFNELPLFKGADKVIKNGDGITESVGSLEFSDFKLADVDLGRTPISAGSGADTLRLQAIVDKDGSALDGQTFNLIFGSGSTSDSSFRITDVAGNQTIVKMEELTATNFTTNGSNEWSREFTYSSGTGLDVGIKQTVQVQDTSADEKNYVISYEFDKSADVANLEFMFHADTAYNNDDLCEAYFINGNRVENFCVYSQTGSALTDGSVSAYLYEGTIPDSLSIVDTENALAFSEKISFGGAKPDSLSIGHYSQIDDWSYYESLDTQLGGTAERRDLGFSLYYDLKDLTQSNEISFNYGIANTETDTNLYNVPVSKDTRAVVEHSDTWSVWIQSGADSGVGMHVTIGEMNTEVLGLKGLDVSTVEGAEEAMNAAKKAVYEINTIRSTIGAQQNRLEHIVANEENVVENTTAAESRICDTDMATEMVRYSNLSILEQVGHSMMAQANQTNQGVLSLLQ